MALLALSARLGVGASRMIVKAVGGAGTGKANSFSRTLKIASDSNGGRGFSQIRRFSAGTMARFPEQITKDPSQQGVCYLVAYLSGLGLCCLAPFGLKHIANRRAERRKPHPHYGEFKEDELRQFGDDYFGDQWPGADDRKLAELGKEIALLGGALNKCNRGIGELSVGLNRCDPHTEIARLRKQPLHPGTPDQAFEIRKKCDYVVEEKAAELSHWRAAADEKLSELNREITELLRTIRKENEL